MRVVVPDFLTRARIDCKDGVAWAAQIERVPDFQRRVFRRISIFGIGRPQVTGVEFPQLDHIPDILGRNL